MLNGQPRYKAIILTCEVYGLMMLRISIRPVTRFRNGINFAFKVPHAVFTFVRMLALQSIQMLSPTGIRSERAMVIANPTLSWKKAIMNPAVAQVMVFDREGESFKKPFSLQNCNQPER